MAGRVGPNARSAEFGRLLRANRRALEWRQCDIAQRMTELGFSFHATTVGEIEKGRRTVTLDEWYALTDLFEYVDAV